jgi:hypothetical protein
LKHFDFAALRNISMFATIRTNVPALRRAHDGDRLEWHEETPFLREMLRLLERRHPRKSAQSETLSELP